MDSIKTFLLRGLYNAAVGVDKLLKWVATGWFLVAVAVSIPLLVIAAYLMGASKSLLLGMLTASGFFTLIGITLLARWAVREVQHDNFIEVEFPLLWDMDRYDEIVLQSDIPVLIYIYDDRFPNPQMDEYVVSAGINELGKTKFVKLNLNNNEWFRQTDVWVEGDPFKGGGTGSAPGFILKLDRESSEQIPRDEQGHRLDFWWPVGGIHRHPGFDLQDFINDSITFLKEEGERLRQKQASTPPATTFATPPRDEMN